MYIYYVFIRKELEGFMPKAVDTDSLVQQIYFKHMPDKLIAMVTINVTNLQLEGKGNKEDNISYQTHYNKYKQNGKGFKGYSRKKFFAGKCKSHTMARKATRTMKQTGSVWIGT